MGEVVTLPVVHAVHSELPSDCQPVDDLVMLRPDVPDAAHVMKDHYGRPMQRYALSYEMDDKTHCTEIWAYSFEDAENRVAAMARSLVVQGQVFTEVAG